MESVVTMLVVEDQESDYHFIELAMKESRFPTRVRWVQNGIEATQYLMGEGRFADRVEYPLPDILLLDLKMPGMSGHDLLEWLQKRPQYQVIPTLVMSSSDQPQDIRRSYELGATTYFVKPIRFETFVDLCKHIAGYWSYGMTTNRMEKRHNMRKAS